LLTDRRMFIHRSVRTAHLRLASPRHVNRAVPNRPAKANLRPREYLALGGGR
jgi:hypothetical protein